MERFEQLTEQQEKEETLLLEIAGFLKIASMPRRLSPDQIREQAEQLLEKIGKLLAEGR